MAATRYPAMKPKATEMTKPLSTLSHWARSTDCSDQLTARAPPVRPAMRPWLSEVGTPSVQPKKPQRAMVRRAASTTACPAPGGMRTREEMVSATLELSRYITSTPRKLQTPPRAAAVTGRRARVQTAVAMALGASVKPLIKTAAAIPKKQSSSIPSPLSPKGGGAPARRRSPYYMSPPAGPEPGTMGSGGRKESGQTVLSARSSPLCRGRYRPSCRAV